MRLLAALVALMVGAGLLAVALVRWRGARRRSWRARHVGAAAAKGERAGATLLEAAGYQVTGRQVRHAIVVEVDGERYDAGLRCDYLVTLDGEPWVAEIKTGVEAPSLANPATRRQLLEYQVAYGTVGVVLVDATTGALHQVRFDVSAPAGVADTPPDGSRGGFVVGVALGITGGVVIGVAAAVALGLR